MGRTSTPDLAVPNISSYVTFGLELEAVALVRDVSPIISARNFGRHSDATIVADSGAGVELVTPPLPVLVEMDQLGNHFTADYGSTEDVVADLCYCVDQVNSSCGLHVHLGRPTGVSSLNVSRWEPEQVRAWLGIGAFLEDRMFDMCPSSRRQNRFCKPISTEYREDSFSEFYPVGRVLPRKYDNPKRYCWLNLIETRRQGSDAPGRAAGPGLGTVEIRMLGNVRRHDYVWAWVKLWVKVAAYIAYVNPFQAMMHCSFRNSLAPEIAELNRVRQSGVRE